MPSSDLLLIENDARLIELLAWILEQRGHRVRTAQTFARARELLRERRPDLVLSDYDLGSETAVEWLPRLHEEHLLPSTLVITGYVEDELTATLRALPCVVGILPKPFEVAQLEQWLARLRTSPPASFSAGSTP